ncbi:MAG: hypothetical protein Q8Q09_14470 [Deltaproteobacteria bacterium]|nr:hypothetical protein [Deltaproteobacteria bacterium]
MGACASLIAACGAESGGQQVLGLAQSPRVREASDVGETDASPDARGETSVGPIAATNARGQQRRRRWARDFGERFDPARVHLNQVTFKVADGANVRVRSGGLARVRTVTSDDVDRMAWLYNFRNNSPIEYAYVQS